MKNILSSLLLSALLLGLTACGGAPAARQSSAAQSTELTVFAAASLTEALEEIAVQYKAAAPDVTLVFSFDSSGALSRQIQEGAVCDLFLSAAPKQMDVLDEAGLLRAETRLDLLENKAVLAVPEGNPKSITSFGQLPALLSEGDILLAMGNSDVPVGQYTREIFAHYGVDEAAVAGALTYGSNAKEVATQVRAGAVDCGVVYATDARAADLTVVDTATAELCSRVVYPAAVLKDSTHADTARAFLDYLRSDEAAAVFETAGFTPIH